MAMIRSSQSERAGHLLPAELERHMRAQLRQMRFGQPQEYARLEHSEVRKFLASESVLNWLSEWNLSRTFGGSTMGGSQCGACGTVREMADFSVQCVAEDIDAEMGQNSALGRSAFPFPPVMPHCNGTPRGSWAHQQHNNNSFLRQNNHRRWAPLPSSMDASTNTQTTAATTTTASGGTGARMRVFRRASWLEEYAQQQLQKLEEAEAEKLQREKDGKLEQYSNNNDRRKGNGRGRWWTGSRCWPRCCGRRSRSAEVDTEERIAASSSSSSSAAPAVPSSSSSSGQPPSAQRLIVKRITLSSPRGTAAEEQRQNYSNPQYQWTGYCNGRAGYANGYCVNRGDWHCRNGAAGGGNYDNVPEEWTEW